MKDVSGRWTIALAREAGDSTLLVLAVADFVGRLRRSILGLGVGVGEGVGVGVGVGEGVGVGLALKLPVIEALLFD
jgi:hypothetical protein